VKVVCIIKMMDEIVTLDGNHPLAGQNLEFDVEITDSRDATNEELAHGHAHGAGGHHH
jgi:FKBP-type peptidyl-prolyl cis-trans isomerase SlyD